MSRDQVVAIGFLTRDDLSLLGEGFRRHFAVEDINDFSDLIEKLDRIEAAQNATPLPPTTKTRP